MIDFNFRVRALHLDFVITFFGIGGKISQRELPVEEKPQIPEKRVEADRRYRALKIGTPAVLVG